MKTYFRQLIALICLLLVTTLEANSEKKPFLILTNPANPGLGAVISSVLTALDLYDRGIYSGIHVDLTSGCYLDPARGPNWWEYYFEPINIGDRSQGELVASPGDVAYFTNSGYQMSRERGYELIQRYIRLKPEIKNEIDNFINKNFKGNFVIGIHHRGTDKKLEAPPVPYDLTLFHANWWMSNTTKKDRPIIFVATDDQHFLNLVKREHKKKVKYGDFIRSDDGNPLHYTTSLYYSNYEKGKEALIDCILLSKCNILIFPAASAFSMLALKFNPYILAIPLSGN